MDKKKVIELIKKAETFLHNSKKEELDYLYDLLTDIEYEVLKPDWISVEDDLPDIDEKVLVCNEKIPYMWWDSSISSDVADMWKDEHGFLKEDHITHWRKIDKLEV